MGARGAGGSMRSRSIAAPVNLSTIERSPPPRDWTLRSPRLSRRVEDGLRATGPFELIAPARIAFSRSVSFFDQLRHMMVELEHAPVRESNLCGTNASLVRFQPFAEGNYSASFSNSIANVATTGIAVVPPVCAQKSPTRPFFSGARVQMSLCLSTHHLVLQLSELGSAAGALETGPGR
jgi:hypothetical protein